MTNSKVHTPSNQGPSFLSRALRANVPTATAPLQGLRVLSNIAIVMTHTTSFSMIMLGLSPPVEDVLVARSGFPATILVFAMLTVSSFAVDVFFLLSGFCLMAAFAKLSGDTGIGPLAKIPICKRRMPMYIISRYLRLMPVYLCAAAATYLMGWPSCLHIEEIFFGKLAKAQIIKLFKGRHPSSRFHCIIPAWSLEVDFQSQILILIIAALVSSWDALQNVMLFLTMASGFHRAITWLLVPGVPPPRFASIRDILPHSELLDFAHLTKIEPVDTGVHHSILLARNKAMDSFLDWYMGIFSRWGAVLTGAAVWIAMRNNNRFCRAARDRPLASLILAGTLFVWAIVSMVLVLEGGTSISAVSFGFYRILFVFSISIIVILTCTVGNEIQKEKEGRLVGAMKNVLGATVFLWLSRSAYVVFLIHPITAFSLTWMWPRLAPDTISSELLVLGAFRWYLVSVLLAIPFCVIEEAGLTLRKKILSKLRLSGNVISTARDENKHD